MITLTDTNQMIKDAIRRIEAQHATNRRVALLRQVGLIAQCPKQRREAFRLAAQELKARGHVWKR